MLSEVPFWRVYIACGRTDLRKGIDSLAEIVKSQFNLDPFQTGILFLFCGNRSDRIKGLVWEGDGFVLVYKRLERGHYQWPRNQREVMQISPDQYHALLQGLAVIQKKTIETVHLSDIL